MRTIGAIAVLILACALGGAALAAQPASLDDVAAGMEKAQGLLKDGQTGDAVRALQGDVVTQLDALIALYAEKPTPAAQGKPEESAKPSSEGGEQAPVKPAKESAVPPGDWRQGRLPEARQLPGGWAASLPPAEQKKIADTFSTGRLPARYAELLREYNKRLAE